MVMIVEYLYMKLSKCLNKRNNIFQVNSMVENTDYNTTRGRSPVHARLRRGLEGLSSVAFL